MVNPCSVTVTDVVAGGEIEEVGLAAGIGDLLLGGGAGDLDRRARHRALLRVLDGDVDAALKQRLCRGRPGADERERQGEAESAGARTLPQRMNWSLSLLRIAADRAPASNARSLSCDCRARAIAIPHARVSRARGPLGRRATVKGRAVGSDGRANGGRAGLMDHHQPDARPRGDPFLRHERPPIFRSTACCRYAILG